MKRESGKLRFNFDIRAYTMIFALIAIWVIFTVMTDGTFLRARNLALLARQMSVTSILAIGMLLVIVAGHIDLSVGSVAGLTGAVAAILQVWFNWSTASSIAAAIALGIAIGVWQGFWVSYKKVPAFIVSLGGMMIFRGILMGIAKGQTVAPLSDSFKFIGQAYLSTTVGMILAGIGIVATIYFIFKSRTSRIKYGFEVENIGLTVLKAAFYSGLIVAFIMTMNAYEGVPVPVILVLVLVLLFTFITTKTKFGRYVYAIGGNVEAARLSGININKITMLIFIISSLLASIGGVVLTARLNAATINAGNMFELDAVAACVIGGTSLMGGSGSVAGAIIGALVMASLDNGMSLMNTQAFYQYIVKGLILIIAVWVDIATKNKGK
jgi:D-xylose transport system permease protein